MRLSCPAVALRCAAPASTRNWWWVLLYIPSVSFYQLILLLSFTGVIIIVMVARSRAKDTRNTAKQAIVMKYSNSTVDLWNVDYGVFFFKDDCFSSFSAVVVHFFSHLRRIRRSAGCWRQMPAPSPCSWTSYHPLLRYNTSPVSRKGKYDRWTVTGYLFLVIKVMPLQQPDFIP
jgi:hypothetical protein